VGFSPFGDVWSSVRRIFQIRFAVKLQIQPDIP
jgi:hypothetical protein